MHLYPKSYPDIAALLAKVVKRKMQNGQERPLDVLLCVNSIRPARVFRRLILEQLQTDAQREYFEKKIGLVETLTNGGGHLPDEQFLREHPNAVVASSGEDLPVDGAAFRGEIPDDVPLRTLDRFEERLIYKLWYGNMRHLSVALYAYHRGETLMCNAAASAYERECVEQAGQEALFAVMQEFGFTLEELVKEFDYHNMSKSPAVFDMTKLRWMNGEYLKKMDFEPFYAQAEPYLKAAITKPLDLKKIAAMVKTRIEVFPDIAAQVDFFETLPEYDPEMYVHKKMKTTKETSLETLKEVLPLLEAQEDYSNDALYETLAAYVAEKGVKTGFVMWPIRTAVSGKQMTPAGATEIMEVLGKEESLERIRKGIALLEA